MRYFSSAILAIFGLCLCACQPINRFEKVMVIEDTGWKQSDTLEFTFHPADTATYFKESILIRHTNLYSFQNIWLGKLLYVGDSLVKKDSFQLQLASNQSAEWLGNCISDICEIDAMVSLNNHYEDEDYTVKLLQINRQDPLQDVLSVGYRIQPQ